MKLAYLQVDSQGVSKDSDGYTLLRLPLRGFIQGEDGLPYPPFINYQEVALSIKDDEIVIKVVGK